MERNQKENKFYVNIFGSCVSRDVLEVQKERKILLQAYIAREAIASVLAEPVGLEPDKLQLDSNFQKNMIIHDFQKDAFGVFAANQSDYIMVDFIEERFPLAKIGSSYVTYSNELMTSGYIAAPKLLQWQKKGSRIWQLDQRKKSEWRIGKLSMDQAVSEFSQRLLSLYSPKQIIIHEVYLSDYYMDREKVLRSFPKNHLKNNKQMNERYEAMYQQLKQCIPAALVINVSRDYVADEKHKWGLSPMHFQNEYYERVLEEIYEAGRNYT